MGHLLSFAGTDTIPAIIGAEHYYGADIEKELVGTSIPASEHSIQCTYEDDMEYFTQLISKVHPTRFVLPPMLIDRTACTRCRVAYGIS